MAVSTPPGFYHLGREVDLRTGQATVGTAATLIVPSNRNRLGVVITNPTSVTVYIGKQSQVNATNGHALLAGQSISLVSSHSVYGVVAASTQVVTYLEETLIV